MRVISLTAATIASFVIGCSSTAPIASTPPVPGDAVARLHSLGMAHVLTSDLDDTSPDRIRIGPEQARPWLDWVVADPPHSTPAKLAGLTVMLYTDPNRVAPGEPMYTSDESTFAHDCSGRRITVTGSPDYLMDVHSTHLWTLWPQELALFLTWGAAYDYVFEDSADEIQTVKLSAEPCNFVQSDWTAHTNDMDQQFGAPIMYNGLGLIPLGQASPGPSIGLNPTTHGGMSEDCYVGRTPSGYYYAPHWNATENTEIRMAQAGKYFICQANSYAQASASSGMRMYFYASFLMTYDRSDQLVQTNFSTPSQLHVMPEAQLVPESPLVSTPGDINVLKLSSGVFGREYASCYYAGRSIGACAVVVNPNKPKWSQALAFPWPTKYHHTMTVSGPGVYDGGTASLTGPEPPAKVPGGTGLIVFP